jgi:6-phosphogluconolactonase/glucosamine-6-phosphate isomerase/deaminase
MHELIVTNREGATRAVVRGLDKTLESGLKVLWLLCGGSNVQLELDVFKALKHATRDKLVISLVDDRFVAMDSQNSNWHQLIDGGLNGERAQLEPPVVDWSLSIDDAAHDWAVRLQRRIDDADAVIALYGIGPDGHIAGIVPNGVAVAEREKLVVGYQGHDFPRITTTPLLIPQLDLAIAVVMGDVKKPVLERFQTDLEPAEQPAQLLKQAAELVVYTDQEVGKI